MAPRKRKADGGEGTVAKPSQETSSRRVTRSSTRLANANSAVNSVAEVPAKKRKKGGKANKKAQAAEEEEEKEEEPETENGSEEEKGQEKHGGNESNKTIIIEHCKQCNSFKTRAIQVKNGLENEFSGITVLVNPEKPRRGCFEVREQDGEVFISLLDMKRPFTPMKELDMDKVTSDIIDKIK